MAPLTVWVIVATLYMPNGAKFRYTPTVEFPDSSSCFVSADKISREWLEKRQGWAMCVPKDSIPKDVAVEKK